MTLPVETHRDHVMKRVGIAELKNHLSEHLRAAEVETSVIARSRATALDVLAAFDLVRVNRSVLARAAEPFPTLVRTLDAIHVARGARR